MSLPTGGIVGFCCDRTIIVMRNAAYPKQKQYKECLIPSRADLMASMAYRRSTKNANTKMPEIELRIIFHQSLQLFRHWVDGHSKFLLETYPSTPSRVLILVHAPVRLRTTTCSPQLSDLRPDFESGENGTGATESPQTTIAFC